MAKYWFIRFLNPSLSASQAAWCKYAHGVQTNSFLPAQLSIDGDRINVSACHISSWLMDGSAWKIAAPQPAPLLIPIVGLCGSPNRRIALWFLRFFFCVTSNQQEKEEEEVKIMFHWFGIMVVSKVINQHQQNSLSLRFTPSWVCLQRHEGRPNFARNQFFAMLLKAATEPRGVIFNPRAGFNRSNQFSLFWKLNLIEPILRALLQNEGYTNPTPIQEQSIPVLLQRKDLLGCVQTGTGNRSVYHSHSSALAYRWTVERKTDVASKCLVLTPTRELAIQIGDSFTAYGRHLRLKHTVILVVYRKHAQTRYWWQGVDILIATGRLLDLMDQRYVKLEQL